MASRRAGTSSQTTQWIIISLVVLVAVVAALAIYYSSFLGARLSGGDAGSDYTPLVRHHINGATHCYDTGTDFCERLMDAEKEFTLAYLFKRPPRVYAEGGGARWLEYNEVWGCYGRKDDRYFIGTSRSDCRSKGYSAYHFGYLARSQEFEAPVLLYRCYNQELDNHIVTDDQGECEQAQHTDEVTELGFAAMAGHLPQGRLNGLCGEAARAGVLAEQREQFCHNAAAETDETVPDPASPAPSPVQPPPPSPSPSPVPEVVSWQNPNNRYDVDGSGDITLNDLLVTANVWRSQGGPHQPTVERNGAPPPYIDVDGNGFFNIQDYRLVNGEVSRVQQQQ